MSPYVLHHSVAAYGKDAGVFRPERWIEADDAQRRDMENFLITFGTGTRVCGEFKTSDSGATR
jgi:cytochrome P450